MREMTPCVRNRIHRIANELLGENWDAAGAGVEAILCQSAEQVTELCSVIRGIGARLGRAGRVPKRRANPLHAPAGVRGAIHRRRGREHFSRSARKLRLVGGDGEDA